MLMMKKFLLIIFTILGILFMGTEAISQAPVIGSFSPIKGAVGTLVTISGSNLSTPTSLTIGGTTALIVSNTVTQLVAMVMPGAVNGAIAITTAGGNTSASGSFTVTAVLPPLNQQGNKLVGTGGIGSTLYQGWSSAISGDGNTVIVGGPFNNAYGGAAWVFTRTGTTWSQQGLKIAGSDSIGDPYQGWAVALSANGNTALIGGPNDSGGRGATWVFTRTGTTWTQQGNKLVGTGSIGDQVYQGNSVSLSADGNTALIGGPYDNSFMGALWVFKRNGNTWAQQGSKITATGNIGPASVGYSVALSADGLTAIAGGYYDNNNIGASWVFTTNGTTWSQQGSKLVGSGYSGSVVFQGWSVALNANGNTAVIGGPGDNNSNGATWVFTRSGSTWTQQGSKLIGSGAGGSGANQGNGVATSADGNTCLIGANYDDGNIGATWVFSRSGNTWSQNGNKLIGTGSIGAAQQGTSLAMSANGSNAIVGGYSDDGQKGAAWIFIPASTNADLSNLLMSSGTLNPGFSSANIIYTSSVPNATATVTVTPTLADARSTIQVRVNSGAYSAVSNSNPSSPLSLNVGSNTIDVLITAQDGTTTKTYTITVSKACPGVSAVFSGSASICQGSSTNLSVALTGGVSPFTVVFDGNTINNYISGSNIPVSPTTTTTYNLSSVTDGNNCTATISGSPVVTLKVNVGITSAAAAGNPICPGATTTLTANGVAGTNAILTWRSGANGTGSNLGTGLTLPNVIAGTYYARVTGDCGSPAEAVVTVSNNVAPTVGNQNTTTCSGIPFSINPSGVPAGTTYTWSVPAYSGTVSGGGAQNNKDSISETLNNSGNTTGTATYTVTPRLGSCSGNDFTAIVTVYPLPTPTFTVFPSPNTCASNSVTYTTQSGMSDYLWNVQGTENADYTVVSGSTGTTSNSATLLWLTGGNKIVTINYKNLNGCSGIKYDSANTLVTIGTQPAVGIAVSAGTNPACLNGNVSFSASPVNGGISPSYQWYKNGISDPSGTGVTYTVSGIIPGNTPTVYVVMTVTPGSCVTSNTATSTTSTITLVSNSWSGGYSNIWGDGRNWCSGFVPTATSDVYIPITLNKPVISGNTDVKNIIIAAGASVTMSNCTLTVNGTVTDSGLFAGIGNSGLRLTYNGNIGTLYFAPGGLGILKLTGLGASATLGNALSIYNELSVENASLTTNGLLTMKSNGNGTSCIGLIATGFINGNVTVERYIPQNGFRAWRLLSVPVKGSQTFKQAWQENQAPLANGNPGYGTLLTSTFTGNGYDAQTSGNSLLGYNSTVNSYVAVTTTNNPMQTDAGYMVYIRGDRSATITGSVQNPTATTLRTNGQLYMGTQPIINVPDGQNVLVGNIYASAIDFDRLLRSGVNSYKVWDPKLLGTNNVGAFQTFSAINGYDPIPGGGSYGSIPNSRIESGQAFFVTTATGGTIQLIESAKTNGSRNVFKTSKTLQQLKTNLYVVNGANKELADGNAIVFDNDYGVGNDDADVLKISNIGENIYLNTNGKHLVIEGRKPVTAEDIFQLGINNLKPMAYMLEFIPANMDKGLVAYLEDKYMGTSTPISLQSNTVINFVVDANAASKTENRFRIVLKSEKAAAIVLSAYPNGYKARLEWKANAERLVKQYEIEYSTDNLCYTKVGMIDAATDDNHSYIFDHENPSQGNNYYRVKQWADGGVAIYSGVAKVAFGKSTGDYLIYPNPVVNNVLKVQFIDKAKGTYTLTIFNKEGRTVFSKKVNHSGGNGTQTVHLSTSLPAGTYHLEIVGENGERVVENVVVGNE